MVQLTMEPVPLEFARTCTFDHRVSHHGHGDQLN